MDDLIEKLLDALLAVHPGDARYSRQELSRQLHNLLLVQQRTPPDPYEFISALDRAIRRRMHVGAAIRVGSGVYLFGPGVSARYERDLRQLGSARQVPTTYRRVVDGTVYMFQGAAQEFALPTAAQQGELPTSLLDWMRSPTLLQASDSEREALFNSQDLAP